MKTIVKIVVAILYVCISIIMVDAVTKMWKEVPNDVLGIASMVAITTLTISVMLLMAYSLLKSPKYWR